MPQDTKSPLRGRELSSYRDEVSYHPSLVHQEREVPPPRVGRQRTSVRFTSRLADDSPPGWVEFRAKQGRVEELGLEGLKLPSMLTLYLDSPYMEHPEPIEGMFSPSELEEHRRHLRTILSDLSRLDSAFSRSVLGEIDERPESTLGAPPSRTVMGLLYGSGWRPPHRGAVITLPSWKADAGGKFLVISHTRFNNTFPFPDVCGVRLVPTSDRPSPKHHILLGAKEGLTVPMIADCSTAFSFSFSRLWLEECARCYKPPKFPHRFKVPSGPHAGRCLRCDGIVPLDLWPNPTSRVRAVAVNRVVDAVFDYLEA